MPKLDDNPKYIAIQLQIQERVLEYISEEVHNNIGQMLSLASLSLSNIPLIPNDEVPRSLDQIKDIVNTSIDDLRQLSIRPDKTFISRNSLHDSFILMQKLIWKRRNLLLRYVTHGEEPVLDRGDKIVLFGIIQETLHLIYAGLSPKEISFEYAIKQQEIQLSISCQITNENPKSLFFEKTSLFYQNIEMMRQQAELIDARLHLIFDHFCVFRLVYPLKDGFRKA